MRAWIAALGLLALTSCSQMSTKTAQPVAGSIIKDCRDCPEMVVIPAGSAVLGSSVAERDREHTVKAFADREWPQHPVTIAKPFAIGKFEITRGLYARFAKDTKRPDKDCSSYDKASNKWIMISTLSWRSPGFAQADNEPVVCVDWGDAQDFTAWLSKLTGKRYRLPTETEWEYTARAGTTTARYWGDAVDDICTHNNISDRTTARALGNPDMMKEAPCEGTRKPFSEPVGSYAPNQFGVYDILGNVWEWTEDCYRDVADGVAADQTAFEAPNCQYRTLRGGGWNSAVWTARAAIRGKSAAVARASAGGIRVARDLD